MDAERTFRIRKVSELSGERPDIVISHGLPFPMGTVGMIVAPGGTGKTMLSIAIAYGFLAVRPWYRVALWLTEDPIGGIKMRCDAMREWFASNGVTARNEPEIIDEEPVKFTSSVAGSRSRVSKRMAEVKQHLISYDVIVIDPLTSFNGGDENNNDDAREFMDALNFWARKERKLILLIHHASKDTSMGAKGRGASALSDASRFVMELSYDSKIKRHSVTIRKENYGLVEHWAAKDESRMIDVIPPRQFWKKPQLEHEPTYRISVNDHEKGASGYRVMEVTMEDIAEVIIGIGNYSPSIYQDGYRNSDNALPGQDLMMFDFDHGMTIDEAKKMFSQFNAVIATTRNHQRDKHGVVCDRFRVVIPFASRLELESGDYSDLMDEIVIAFGADEACAEMSRMYFCNPDAEVYFTGGSALFEWIPFWSRVLARRESDVREHNNAISARSGDRDSIREYYEGYFAENYVQFSRNVVVNRMIWMMRVLDRLDEDEVWEVIKDLNSRSKELSGANQLYESEIRHLMRRRKYQEEH